MEKRFLEIQVERNILEIGEGAEDNENKKEDKIKEENDMKKNS